jgi:zinc transport system ATP-binding protein
MNNILEIHALSAGYGDDLVLRDVNLKISDFDFIGVVGPNGGGKTTLLKVMMGLIKPFSGSIKVNKRSEKANNNVFGYLPQITRIDKKFPISVLDVVISGIMPRMGKSPVTVKEAKVKARLLLERVGGAHLTEMIIGDLSGGQLQRVLLARAIISNPELLVLDEPDTFVDNNFERDLYELLKELNKEMAIIMVSHDLGIISSYVKTIACVNGGLHYHHSNAITEEVLESYNCPIDLITHGDLPHRVLKEHEHGSHAE